jgi:hypothetical protein
VKNKIEDMAKGLGIPDEALAHVFEPVPELEGFPIGEIATFSEFINAPEGTEFVTVAIKDGDSVRNVVQSVPTDVSTREGDCGRFKDPENDNYDVERLRVTWLSYSDGEGDQDIPFTDIHAKMEKVGAYIGRWKYTVYHVKK